MTTTDNLSPLGITKEEDREVGIAMSTIFANEDSSGKGFRLAHKLRGVMMTAVAFSKEGIVVLDQKIAEDAHKEVFSLLNYYHEHYQEKGERVAV